MRRGVTALTSAAALATGLLGAVSPSAQAATADIQGGKIALYGGSTGLETINSDGTGLTSVPGITNVGHTPNWAPDGSRVVAGGSQLVTGRTTGTTGAVTLPWATGVRSSASYEDPTYWLGGRYVVFSTGGQLAIGPSDGSLAPVPLLTDAQGPATVCDVHPTGSPNGTLAFERRDADCGDSQGIWTYDNNTDTVQRLIASGSSPVFSADGSTLVFTRQVDGWTQLFTADADGGNVQQVTTDAADHLDPSWDPAGGRIAYDSHSSQGEGSDDVAAVKILTLSDGTIATLTTDGSRPAWQPLQKNTLVRVYGTGPIGIDVAASRWTFDTVGGPHEDGLIAAKSAVLVNKTNATYSAPGISLAGEKQAPTVLTSSTSLDASAAAELTRVLPKGSTVYLPGNTKMLSDKVADQVTALGFKPLRMDQPDLSSLSARIATQITARPSWIFVADGNDYHDPIAASTAAAALGYKGTGVVLLTNGTTVPAAVKNYLNSVDPDSTSLVSVGATATQALEGTSLNQAWSFSAIDGAGHEDVAANLARGWWSAPFEATVEDTWSWQNAVAGGAATATYGPMLWSTEATLSAASQEYLSEEAASVSDVETFGGNASYAPANRTAIGDSIAAGSAWTDTVWAAAGELPAASVVPRSLSKAKTATPPAHAPAAAGPEAPAPHLPAPTLHTEH
jgi:hypothetical protein